MSANILPLSCLDSSVWQEAQITKAKSNNSYRSIVDTRTGDIYKNEDAGVISVKCVMILMGLPIYTAGTMVWFAAKSIIDLGCCNFSDAASDLWNVVRSPAYALAVAVAALFGIFCPLEGRRLESTIERSWQRGESCKEDIRIAMGRSDGDGSNQCISGIERSKCCYLAFCFQPVGNISDESIAKVNYRAST